MAEVLGKERHADTRTTGRTPIKQRGSSHSAQKTRPVESTTSSTTPTTSVLKSFIVWLEFLEREIALTLPTIRSQ
jgi:hypothetical protein